MNSFHPSRRRLFLGERSLPLQPAQQEREKELSVDGKLKKKFSPAPCGFGSSSYLCTPFQKGSQRTDRVLRERKKVLPIACEERSSSYLCSPLQRKAFGPGNGSASWLVEPRESEKKSFSKVLQRGKKFLPLHPLPERSQGKQAQPTGLGREKKEKKAAQACGIEESPYLCSPYRKGGKRKPRGFRQSPATGRWEVL